MTNVGTERGHKRDMVMASGPLASLRFALKHLYDPGALRSSPLIRMLESAGQPGEPTELRRTLSEAIESLKPADDVPAQSPAWRAYEILYYRYVQRSSQEEVADQLGLSVRHLKREQHRALEVLAERLRERYNLDLIEQEGAGVQDTNGEGAAADGELQWLEELPAGKPLELASALPAVLELVQPMAGRYGVRLEVAEDGAIPAPVVHGVALRQILLSLLCVAMRRTAGGNLRIAARCRHWQVEIEISGRGAQPRSRFGAEDEGNLAVARRLVGSCGGRLELTEPAEGFAATLVLPAAEQVTVLAIDDNVDAIRLLQRYTSNSRYRVFGAQTPEQAISLAGEIAPQAIILDVMMPEVDGWELLGRLRQHPFTSAIPIIACTIVAQEELAYSLGVTGFLRKPVSRRAFLAALDRLLPAMTASRPTAVGRSADRAE